MSQIARPTYTEHLNTLLAAIQADLLVMGRTDLEAVIAYGVGGAWPGRKAVCLVDRATRRWVDQTESLRQWRAHGRFDHTRY